ncbi:Vacuolar protease A, partial [Rhizopus stolonifer]
LFGDINQKHFEGELSYVPVTTKKYWQTDLTSISVGSTSILSTPIPAVLDTGTTLIVAPKNISDSIHALIPDAKYDPMYGWRMPCAYADSTSTESIVIRLADKDFPIYLKDLVRAKSSADTQLCFSGIAGANLPFIILGDTFLRNYYSVYDFGNARIGLAKSKA